MDSNIEDAVVAASMVRGLLDVLRIHPHDGDKVELCLTEALVNAVRHAYGDEGGHAVHLEFELESGAISFAIRTPGRMTTRTRLEEAIHAARNFDPTEHGALAEGGRGMLIIAESMDGWDYHAAGGDGVLTMRKMLRTRQPVG